jgi:hypothetical protein
LLTAAFENGHNARMPQRTCGAGLAQESLTNLGMD